ncbi:MAG: MBL fold metallo-hydrolase [Pseudomonadota bacterium]
MTDKALVEAFFDPDTHTVSYVVYDAAPGTAAIIDSVLDFDLKSGRTGHHSADRIIAFCKDKGLEVDWILETHVHADHLSAAPYLKDRLGGRVGIGENIATVQKIFKDVFNVEREFATDGRQFDRLFKEGDRFAIGSLPAHVLHTPGHTPACLSYVIGDAAFVGDTVFMPDYGTARCDFPGGDARALYRSIKKILSLPPETRIFTAHDYAPNGREVRWQSTVAEQRAQNIHVRDGISEDDFVAMRTKRDAGLAMPTLILPSVQVNMRAGAMPPPEDNGKRYLKIPLDQL